eukprot:TRINITY_DN25957_c0_g2_i1.p1 TRINITY_DN25957_c0_g2~~TRINITY_DN25957_c0_g2_i1.p1  ORF type:complete len:1237 (+),score=377.17 TRINITY_DN25957_c0_g2_i1:76-3711(+)
MPLLTGPRQISLQDAQWATVCTENAWQLQCSKGKTGVAGFFQSGKQWRIITAAPPHLEIAVAASEREARADLEQALHIPADAFEGGDDAEQRERSLCELLDAVRGIASLRRGDTGAAAAAAAVAVAVRAHQDVRAQCAVLCAAAAAVVVNGVQRKALGVSASDAGGWFGGHFVLPPWLGAAALVAAAAAAVEADLRLWQQMLDPRLWVILDPDRRCGERWWEKWVEQQGDTWQGAVDQEGRALLTWKEHIACLSDCVELVRGRLLAYKEHRLQPVPYQADTTVDKVQRAVTYVGDAVATVAPFAGRWQIALQFIGNTGSVLAQHGPMGLGMLVLNDRVRDALGDFVACLRSDIVRSGIGSDRTQTTNYVGLMVGMYYLMAYRRGLRGNDPRLGEREHAPAAAGTLQSDLDPDLLRTIRYYAPIVQFGYEDEPARVQRLATLRGYQLVGWGADNPGKHPAYFLLCHSGVKEAILLIRGTKSAGDMMIDATGKPQRMQANGREYWVHRGVLRGALWIKRSMEPALRLLASWGYKVTLAGHSLGGGVSVVLAAMLRDTIDVHVVAFAAPPVSDLALSLWSRQWCTHCFLGDDVIVRSRIHSLRDLLEIVSDPAFQERTQADAKHDLHGVKQRLATVWAPPQRSDATGYAYRHCDKLGAPVLTLDHSAALVEPDLDKGDLCSCEPPPFIACPECLSTQQAPDIIDKLSIRIECRRCARKSWPKHWRAAGDPPLLRLLMRPARDRPLRHVALLGNALTAAAAEQVLVAFVEQRGLAGDVDDPWQDNRGPWVAHRRRFWPRTTVEQLLRFAAELPAHEGAAEAAGAAPHGTLRLWAFARPLGTSVQRPCIPLDDPKASLGAIFAGRSAGSVLLQRGSAGPSEGDVLLLLQYAAERKRGRRGQPPRCHLCVAAHDNTPLSVVAATFAAQLQVQGDPSSAGLEMWELGAHHRRRLLPRGRWREPLAALGLRSGSLLLGVLAPKLHTALGDGPADLSSSMVAAGAAARVGEAPAQSLPDDAVAHEAALRERSAELEVQLRRLQEQRASAGDAALDPVIGHVEARLARLRAELDWPPFFAAGRVVHLYRDRGTVRGAELEQRAPLLLRIEVSEEMVDDHRLSNIVAALRALRTGPAAEAERERLAEWEPFDARSSCSCCGNPFGWQKAGLSGATRELRGRDNCHVCGMLVCSSCCKHSLLAPDRGILIPAKACDKCFWSLH